MLLDALLAALAVVVSPALALAVADDTLLVAVAAAVVLLDKLVMAVCVWLAPVVAVANAPVKLVAALVACVVLPM